MMEVFMINMLGRPWTSVYVWMVGLNTFIHSILMV